MHLFWAHEPSSGQRRSQFQHNLIWAQTQLVMEQLVLEDAAAKDNIVSNKVYEWEHTAR